MHKIINTESIMDSLAALGLTQKELAQEIGVSGQAVTNWLKGKDFPRPAALLKLATFLNLEFDEIVVKITNEQPVVAFRKKGNAKTTKAHITKAEGIGRLLKPLVPYLPEQNVLRTLITSPSKSYEKLHIAAAQTRDRLGIGKNAVLEYEYLISEFKNSGAILVPVLWGNKKRHENALHIRLPMEDVTFIFLNLDTKIEDFKFWMAHELAHVYTPELAGSDEGEDFADAFAGALLFPIDCAKNAYNEANRKKSDDGVMRTLKSYADGNMISLNTVHKQIKQYAKLNDLRPLSVKEVDIHKVRNSVSDGLISEALFEPMPPTTKQYIALAENVFQTCIFKALERMINEKKTGISYLQQILDLTVYDAKALHEELSN